MIDISAHRSKSIGELAGDRFDLVVSLCDEVSCTPRHLLPQGTRYLHKAFPDPGSFKGDEQEVLAAYRDVRDRIESWIREEFGPGSQPGGGRTPETPIAPYLQKT